MHLGVCNMVPALLWMHVSSSVLRLKFVASSCEYDIFFGNGDESVVVDPYSL
jgi:hypothetical protein